MSNIPEQTAVWIPTPRASAASVKTSNGIHPEVGKGGQHDSLSTLRLPNGTRRDPSTAPTVIHNIQRHGPPPTQRASRSSEPVNPHISVPAQNSQHHRWLNSAGAGMVVMAFGLIAASNIAHWWQGQQETMQYGYPRTYQTDANVNHRGMSHFTVENLYGRIIVIEVQPGDLSHSHIYQGPDLSGAGADVKVATIAFQDINGDGSPDMIIAVDGERILFINDRDTFRAITSTDTIKGGSI